MEQVCHSRGCTDFNGIIILTMDEVLLTSSVNTSRKALLPEILFVAFSSGMHRFKRKSAIWA
jgi:hypothetical protein